MRGSSPPRSVSGTVTNTDGAPITGVRVDVVDSKGPASVLTGSNGTWSAFVAPGDATVSYPVMPDGYEAVTDTSRSFDLEAGDSAVFDLKVRLKDGSVTVAATDPGGPIQGVGVTVDGLDASTDEKGAAESTDCVPAGTRCPTRSPTACGPTAPTRRTCPPAEPYGWPYPSKPSRYRAFRRRDASRGSCSPAWRPCRWPPPPWGCADMPTWDEVMAAPPAGRRRLLRLLSALLAVLAVCAALWPSPSNGRPGRGSPARRPPPRRRMCQPRRSTGGT